MDVNRVEPIQQIATGARPASISASMLAFVAASTRASEAPACANTRAARTPPPSSTAQQTAPAGPAVVFTICRRGTACRHRQARSTRRDRAWPLVNAASTWPNISLSNTVSARLPIFTVTKLRPRRPRALVDQACDEALPAAALGRHQHVRAGQHHALDRLEDGPRRRRGTLRSSQCSQRSSGGARGLNQSVRACTKATCVLQHREQAFVVPRLLDEVLRAASHRSDRDADGAPRRRRESESAGHVSTRRSARPYRGPRRPTWCRAWGSSP